MNALQRDLKKLVPLVESLGKETVAADPHRQRFHLQPPVGWLNDPNGLCVYGGQYHAFFQYGPFDVNGGVKHWGHAVSTDLLHWEQLPVMLYPDEPFDCHGAYSGSALMEDGTMYLYYTGNVKHPGNFDYIKEGRGHNVCLAVSKDGVTLDSKQCLLTNRDYPAGLTCHVRDPKVFAYEGRYYMVLGARTLEDKGEVLVLESTDKLRWTHINTLTTPEPFGYMWECPDLFQLKNESCMDRWVFISADGYYFVGDFDGYRFTGYTRRRMAYLGTLPYAAQTWANVNGRVLMTAWLRTANTGKPWRGTMSLPLELSLGGAEERLCLAPARELLAARQVPLCEGANAPCDITINVKAAEATLDIADPGTPSVSLACSAAEITFDIKNGTCTVGDETVHMRSRSFRVFFDCGTVEIFSLDDGGYYSAATAECGTVGTLEVRSDAAISLSVWPLG